MGNRERSSDNRHPSTAHRCSWRELERDTYVHVKVVDRTTVRMYENDFFFTKRHRTSRKKCTNVEREMKTPGTCNLER